MMDLVVDANVLFSAAVKDSKTAELLLRDDLAHHAPEYIFEEFAGHRGELLEKTHREEADFSLFVAVLRSLIELWPAEAVRPQLDHAREVCPDSGDVPYFALALHLDAAIWSDDRAIADQDAVTVLPTADLLDRLR